MTESRISPVTGESEAEEAALRSVAPGVPVYRL